MTDFRFFSPEDDPEIAGRMRRAGLDEWGNVVDLGALRDFAASDDFPTWATEIGMSIDGAAHVWARAPDLPGRSEWIGVEVSDPSPGNWTITVTDDQGRTHSVNLRHESGHVWDFYGRARDAGVPVERGEINTT